LDSDIRKLRIQTLKTQLEVCQLVCVCIARELQAAYVMPEQKAVLAHRWDKALKESRNLQLAIDMLEGHETDARFNLVQAGCAK
jgi:hypothetical protein